MSNPYNDAFYLAQKNGSLASAQIYVPFILSLFPEIRNVVDIGCGSGAWLSVFADNGVMVSGYDFGKGVLNNLLIPPSCYHVADLSRPLAFEERFDLAISLEVAEHIDIAHADIFITTLVEAADIILFSAAIPGQGGTHHVNMQWPAWWNRKFMQYGYLALDILRPLFWNVDAVNVWYRQNTILFVKQRIYSSHKELGSYMNFNCLPLIHPGIGFLGKDWKEGRVF